MFLFGFVHFGDHNASKNSLSLSDGLEPWAEVERRAGHVRGLCRRYSFRASLSP